MTIVGKKSREKGENMKVSEILKAVKDCDRLRDVLTL